MHKTLLKIVVSVVALFSGLVFAQGLPGADLTGITSATGATDLSMWVWKSIFGQFAENPFAQLGTPSTIMGSLFLVFNTCIFVAGFSWATYGIVSGIVQTASDGEVLGKRMSTVWFPIRMIVGISGMVPVFGGFTLSQAVMMFFTVVGIGIGNSMYTEALTQTANGQTMLSQDPYLPQAQNELRKLGNALFLSGICLSSEASEQKKMTAQSGVPVSDLEVIGTLTNGGGGAPDKPYVVTMGSKAHPGLCGGYSVTNAGSRTNSSVTSFRVNSVDYDAIASAGTVALQTAAQNMQPGINALAAQWVSDYYAAGDNGTVPAIPVDKIDAIIKAAQTSAISASGSTLTNVSGAIKADALANMRSTGWFGLGAWYSTFAEANAAIADAVQAPQIDVVHIGLRERNMATPVAFTEATGVLLKSAEKLITDDAEAKAKSNGSKALADSSIQDSGCGLSALNSIAGTATGNCSLGQGLVSAAIRGTAVGSGGGGSAQAFSLDNQGFVNPIIMMKNLGDYVLNFSTSLIAASYTADVVGKFKDVDPTGFLSKIDKFATTLRSVAFAMMLIGVAMAVYIPLVPFIHWMGAITAYCASIIEGLAGATLHSLAHLEGDGEGMGQRSGHGYLFMLNVLARPALMIIGFFTASALMIALGTIQAKLFLPAMASAQGNSITGVVSIVGFLLIFFVMNWTLLSACFNLIFVITDQVLAFAGNAVNSHLGRETESSVKQAFMVAGGAGRGAMTDAGRALGLANDKRAQAGPGGSGSNNSNSGTNSGPP